MPVGANRSLVLLSACLFLALSWTAGHVVEQNDLRSNPDLGLRAEPRSEVEKDVHVNMKNLDSGNVIPDIKDDVDLGLKPRRGGSLLEHPVSIVDENDLKHERYHPEALHRQRRPITDADISDDLDLGLRHHRMDKEPIPTLDKLNKSGAKKSPTLTDNDITNYADLGLKHETKNVVKEEPISKPKDIVGNVLDKDLKAPISDADIKNDADLGLHRRHRSRNPKKTQLRLQRIAKRKQLILDLKLKRNARTKTNEIDLAQQQRQNLTRPEVILSQTRRSIQNRYRKTTEQNNLAEEYGQIVKRLRLSLYQRKLEQEQQKQQEQLEQQDQTPGNPQLDNICHQYDVDGCSIPFGLPFFFKELFTNSCYRHDICYGCGVEYSFTREDCDRAFRQNMWEACRAKYETTGNGDRDVKGRRRERLLGKLIENLQDRFVSILRQHLEPALQRNQASKETMEKIEERAKFVQRKVMKEWIKLIKEQLYFKKSFGLNSKQRFTHLLYERQSLHVKTESRNEFMYDLNLTTDLCNDLLYNTDDDRVSKMVELSCREVDLLACYFFDQVYFLAVRIFAPFSYHDTPESYCGQPFVKKCLPH